MSKERSKKMKTHTLFRCCSTAISICLCWVISTDWWCICISKTGRQRWRPVFSRTWWTFRYILFRWKCKSTRD